MVTSIIIKFDCVYDGHDDEDNDEDNIKDEVDQK
jgi:hypothetical protein